MIRHLHRRSLSSRIALPLLVPLAALALGGCLGASRGGGARTEVRFCFFGGYEEWKLWNTVARGFEAENPDLKLKLLYWPGANYEDKVKLVMAAGTAPDVLSAQDEPFPNYCRLGQYENLDPYLARHREEYHPSQFFPTALETFRWKGHQHALPWNGGQQMVYYNRRLFREAGLPDPPPMDWTIEQFTDACVRLTKDLDGDGRTDQFGYELASTWMNSLLPYLWIFGGDIVDPAARSCTVNSPEGIRTLQWLRDLRYRLHVSPTPAEFTGAAGAIFMTGKLGMEINGPWRMPFMRETDVDWDIWHVPVGPGGERWSRGTWDGLAMYRHSKVKEAAWRWIRYATGKPGQHEVARAGRAVPPRRSEALSPDFIRPDTPQHEERFIEAMSYFRTQRIPMRWSEMSTVLTQQVEAVLGKKGQPESVAARMEAEINPILRREE